MKVNHTSFLAACLLASATALLAVESGEPAPGFTLESSAGESLSLEQYRGQYVVLEWTNHKCPFVKKFYRGGHMQALQKQLTEGGAVWLQVLSSAPGKQGHLTAAAAEVLRSENEHHSTALLLDSEGTVGRAYDARTTPHVFLIGPEGKLLYQGAIDSIASARTPDIEAAENLLLAAYDSAKAGEHVENPATKPYGCGVKY
jgi:peroxiredoxin